ncbi:hypothetical protein F5Y15DRAFT_388821 [Xylariaceae sp. FL0016]|nr:hypothetical protein F5Y15DRAFT_388821 [Xylariaceae sp. FL0016]
MPILDRQRVAAAKAKQAKLAGAKAAPQTGTTTISKPKSNTGPAATSIQTTTTAKGDTKGGKLPAPFQPREPASKKPAQRQTPKTKNAGKAEHETRRVLIRPPRPMSRIVGGAVRKSSPPSQPNKPPSKGPAPHSSHGAKTDRQICSKAECEAFRSAPRDPYREAMSIRESVLHLSALTRAKKLQPTKMAQHPVRAARVISRDTKDLKRKSQVPPKSVSSSETRQPRPSATKRKHHYVESDEDDEDDGNDSETSLLREDQIPPRYQKNRAAIRKQAIADLKVQRAVKKARRESSSEVSVGDSTQTSNN